MQVLNIIPIDKNKSKVLVDEDFAFPLYKKEILKFNIIIGKVLNNYQNEILPLLKERALKSILYSLKSSDKTEYEIIKKLNLAFYPKNVIKYVIIYCRENSYIDDLSYIKDYIEFNKESKSKNRIRQDLLKKGLKKDNIDEVLNEQYIDELEQIDNIVQKQDLDIILNDRKLLEKLINRLLRKGYKYDLIKKSIKKYK